jgi:hypothetical protein
MTVSPPRVIDSPDADSAMLDPTTSSPLEPEFSEPVSEEPGAMPGESLDPAVPPPALTAPRPWPGPPPPDLDTPAPSLDTPYPPLPRLDVEPPKGVVFTSRHAMGIGHVPAPEPVDALDPSEVRMMVGLAAMAVGFILTGSLGILALIAVYGYQELVVALATAGGRLFS